MADIEAKLQVQWPGFSLDVDLHLPGRGVTALFGPSGSGKTTLLRCIAGLERAPHGRLSFKGTPWQDERLWLPTHRRPLGFVFQEASLFPHLTVQQNLHYGMKRLATPNRASLDQAIDLLGIGGLLSRKPDHLSGGERQRVGIARALAVGPQVLLMDEPLAALDLQRKREVLPYLERLHAQLDIPILYVSHAPDEVARLADHLVVLDAGRVLASGPLNETLSRLDLPIRLADDAAVVLDAVVGDRDAHWHLARLDFAGGQLWARDHGLPLGAPARVQVLARDVGLSLALQTDSSVGNQWPITVEAMGDDSHPGLVLARVRLGHDGDESPARPRLLARLTRRSADALQLVVGQRAWAQVKTVALME
ncbi:MAG: molybdenum ABC transporter ATP-binding protein [Burkholderiales bacterium]|nr:molybdenum ABC transporter ATP-binding protein [Burkholderiales bacterium]MBP6676752.1 molybdenum ABC transporter ATP-binding protein [Vitreoscilla sp.]